MSTSATDANFLSFCMTIIIEGLKSKNPIVSMKVEIANINERIVNSHEHFPTRVSPAPNET